MEKRVYKLKNDYQRYKVPDSGLSKSLYDFRMYVNKSRIQKALNKREELRKEYLRIYRKPSVWWVVLFYYGFIALILLLKKFGF